MYFFNFEFCLFFFSHHGFVGKFLLSLLNSSQAFFPSNIKCIFVYCKLQFVFIPNCNIFCIFFCLFWFSFCNLTLDLFLQFDKWATYKTDLLIFGLSDSNLELSAIYPEKQIQLRHREWGICVCEKRKNWQLVDKLVSFVDCSSMMYRSIDTQLDRNGSSYTKSGANFECRIWICEPQD